jgi:hypothetical protein
MAEALLREEGWGAIGVTTFAELPRVGEFVDYHQTERGTQFRVVAVNHVIIDPVKPASVIITVERVKA